MERRRIPRNGWIAWGLVVGVLAQYPGRLPAKEVTPGTLKKGWDTGAKYLYSHQNEDGSYGARAKPGVTALVIRALATGPRAYVVKDGPFMSRAVKYLLASQREDGSFCEDDGQVKTYQTALAVSTLTTLDDPSYEKAISRGVAFLKSAQSEEGLSGGLTPCTMGALGS